MNPAPFFPHVERTLAEVDSLFQGKKRELQFLHMIVVIDNAFL